MDFTSRSAQPQTRAHTTPAAATVGGGASESKKSGSGSKKSGDPGWLRVASVILLFSLTVLAVAVAALMYFGNPSESKYIMNKKYQAVFLTNGQVYFGQIKNTSSKFIDLQNIYYLSVSQQVQPDQKANTNAQQNVSLVKLGCELHGPYDQMVINRDQVTFWENIRDDGQVVKAINAWVQQNPNGQQCQSASSSSNSSTSNSSTNSSSTGTTTTTPSTTKP